MVEILGTLVGIYKENPKTLLLDISLIILLTGISLGVILLIKNQPPH